MKKRQYIKYENYKKHKLQYGHISTWALWNSNVLKLDSSVDNNDYSLRKDLLIANSEEDYIKKGLDKSLHGDVVILGLNISCPKPSSQNELLNILNNYKDEKYKRIRYEKLIDLNKNNDLFTFANMYKVAGSGTVNGSGYANEFMKSEVLNGAYMTDFVKFTEDKGEIIPSGIPESNPRKIAVTSCLRKDKINIQVKGLKEELDLLDIKPKVFILVHSTLNNNPYLKNEISKELGYKPHFEYLYHYNPLGLPYKKEGFKSIEDMYTCKIKEIIKNIEREI